MARYKSPAMRKYVLRIAALMSFYLVALFGAVYAFTHQLVSGPAAYALAVLPALPVIGVFWAVMRLLVEEPDEYLRSRMVRHIMIATGFCLTVTTIWDFLQNFELVTPGNNGFGAVFFWFMGLGVGPFYDWLTARHGGGTCA